MIVFRIIRAWLLWLLGMQKAVAKTRLRICMKCDKYKKTKLNRDVTFNQCSVCGCPIKAKIRDFKNNCPHPDGAKW